MTVESKFIQYIKENRVADAMEVIKDHLDSSRNEIKDLAQDYVAEHHYGMEIKERKKQSKSGDKDMYREEDDKEDDKDEEENDDEDDKEDDKDKNDDDDKE